MKKVLNFFINNYIIFCIFAFIGWIYEVSWYLIMKHTFVNRGVLFGPFLPIYGFGILILILLLKTFMSKKHYTNNILWLMISTFTITTFIIVTIIEYTTPKIYSVNFFLEKYLLILLLINSLTFIIFYLLIKKFNWNRIDLTPIMIFLFIWIITTLIEYISHYFIDTFSHKLLWDYSKDFLNINKRVNWDASRNFAIGGTILLYTVYPLINKFLSNCKIKTKIIISIIIGFPMILDFIINVILK